MHLRKNRKNEYRIDIRSLSYDEYRMLYALIVSSYVDYKDNGVNAQPVGMFDIHYIKPTVFADSSCLNTLAKLLKLFKK